MTFSVVNCSFGKDSLALALMMLEKNMHIDEILFCDTGKEFPVIYRNLEKFEKMSGRTVTVLKSEHSFDYWMFDHVKTKGKNKGKCGYGWSNMLCRWCTSAMKLQPINKYLKGKGDYISYIGIAYDEPKRHEGIAANVRHPLYDWKVTEKDALAYCYSHGFDFDGLYKHFDRVSCWCCPLKNTKELRILYHHYPKLWNQLKEMDAKAYNDFKGKGVMYYENKFRHEDFVKMISRPKEDMRWLVPNIQLL